MHKLTQAVRCEYETIGLPYSTQRLDLYPRGPATWRRRFNITSVDS